MQVVLEQFEDKFCRDRGDEAVALPDLEAIARAERPPPAGSAEADHQLHRNARCKAGADRGRQLSCGLVSKETESLMTAAT